MPKVEDKNSDYSEAGAPRNTPDCVLKSRTIFASRITSRSSKRNARAVQSKVRPIHLALLRRTKLHLSVNHIVKKAFCQ